MHGKAITILIRDKISVKEMLKMNTYHHLFSPIKVGHTTIKIVCLCLRFLQIWQIRAIFTDELIQHYIPESQGQGRPIVTEVTTVEPTTKIYLPDGVDSR